MIVTEESGIFTLRAGDLSEDASMARFFGSIPNNTHLEYSGLRDDQNYLGSELIHVFLSHGPKTLILSGTTREDAHRIKDIENKYSLSSFGAIFIKRDIDASGTLTILSHTVRCGDCKAIITDISSVRWGVCRVCSERCKHEWKQECEHGTFQGKPFCFPIGRSCTKCGAEKLMKTGEPLDIILSHTPIYPTKK